MDHINFCQWFNVTFITDIYLDFLRCLYITCHNISETNGNKRFLLQFIRFSSMSRFTVTSFCVLANLHPHQFWKL